ncbi:Transcriptional regulator containing GAF, AAA-type ATPase, and DNA-binding Fis domains [Desulfocicer vacuolatum DSM 3385]|uniref:Transcriptional regulator containing GAF, AAA-type ATPase, and DNA-binding Fis domains n=2 Tax=Desulfocicer vacuolatum TaxID=2298 RepID=A0A1W2EQK9_9BACT|nr:Transcriptional regulator containing GAF, AAA-type ATPase, and DNA-binding Fis domains [Desulfocicer vacuolatum DSM 3385]
MVKDLNTKSDASISSISASDPLCGLSSEWEQLFHGAPVGLAIIDQQLRYLHVNKVLADNNEKSVEEHIGRPVLEINFEIASQIIPFLLQTIKTGQAVLNVEFDNSIRGRVGEKQQWLMNCCPIRNEKGEVTRISVATMDVSEVKQAQETMEKKLEFEMLISELSSTFINLPASQISGVIKKGLELIAEFLSVERSSLLEYSEDRKMLTLTHSCQAPGLPKTPVKYISKDFPWFSRAIIEGKIISLPRISDGLPAEAKLEEKYLNKMGIKSHLSFPLNLGGDFLGALSFDSVKVERQWPDALVNRLKLFGEIFAHALARKRSELELRDAFSKIKQLKDQLEVDYTYVREEIKLEHNFEEIVGKSDELKYVLGKVEHVAPTDATVLILGETGTGKELFARALHNASQRKDRPMVKVNCATLPSNLIESELFGHEKGAFTGAHAKKVGRFEIANEGTLFLDEIGELPLELQPKLLRALQNGEFERLGGSRTIKTNIRVIAATNRDLEDEVKNGRFRMDLLYRINIFPITVPSLRDRKTDIPLLVDWFINKCSKKLGKSIKVIPSNTMRVLKKHSWPGNVRELENVVERAIIYTKGSELLLTEKLGFGVSPDCIEKTSKKTLLEIERDHILKILEETYWRIEGKKGAAVILGLNPSTLRSRMRKLKISKPEPGATAHSFHGFNQNHYM